MRKWLVEPIRADQIRTTEIYVLISSDLVCSKLILWAKMA